MVQVTFEDLCLVCPIFSLFCGDSIYDSLISARVCSRIVLLCGAICGPLTSGLKQREISNSTSDNIGIMIADGIYWTANALLYLLVNLDHFDAHSA